MGGLLDELGKRLADRWLPLLVLPGALYLAVAIAGRTLGQENTFDLQRLITQVIAWAKTPAATTAGGQVVILSAALAGSAAVGLTAQVLGSLAERLTLAADWRAWKPPLRQLAQWRVESRRTRWDAAHATYLRHYDLALKGNDPDPAVRRAAYRKRSQIAQERPGRPTWSGDRINAVSARLNRDLHLDLPTIWGCLWLTLPGTARTEITTSRQALASATTLTGWAVLYVALAVWWWPASLIAILLAGAGWHRTRTSADAYATLIEASSRLYVRDLADQLGISYAQPLDQQAGDSLTAVLRSEPPPPPGP